MTAVRFHLFSCYFLRVSNEKITDCYSSKMILQEEVKTCLFIYQEKKLRNQRKHCFWNLTEMGVGFFFGGGDTSNNNNKKNQCKTTGWKHLQNQANSLFMRFKNVNKLCFIICSFLGLGEGTVIKVWFSPSNKMRFDTTWSSFWEQNYPTVTCTVNQAPSCIIYYKGASRNVKNECIRCVFANMCIAKRWTY